MPCILSNTQKNVYLNTMNHYNYKITCSPDAIHILIALMSELPFEAFEEKDNGFDAYIAEKDLEAERGKIEQQLGGWQSAFGFGVEREFVPYKNWNEEWEKHFQPVQVGRFCGIRADFHPAFEGLQYEIVINPKMAFGTGHHETTFMMVQMMEELHQQNRIQNKKVLDFGCGTGILAILASMLRAASPIDAVDIERESFLNTQENAIRNQVNNIRAFQGSLEDVPAEGYDIILANINRNVILEYLPMLQDRVNAGGYLLISGCLKQDQALVTAQARQQHFRLMKTIEKEKWICQLYQTEAKIEATRAG